MTKCPYCGVPEEVMTKCCAQVDNLWKTNAELAGMLQNALEKLKEELQKVKKETS
jgi:hypothetical protein